MTNHRSHLLFGHCKDTATFIILQEKIEKYFNFESFSHNDYYVLNYTDCNICYFAQLFVSLSRKNESFSLHKPDSTIFCFFESTDFKQEIAKRPILNKKEAL